MSEPKNGDHGRGRLIIVRICGRVGVISNRLFRNGAQKPKRKTQSKGLAWHTRSRPGSKFALFSSFLARYTFAPFFDAENTRQGGDAHFSFHFRRPT